MSPRNPAVDANISHGAQPVARYEKPTIKHTQHSASKPITASKLNTSHSQASVGPLFRVDRLPPSGQ